MGLKIAPDRLDFIEFGGVFRQPLDGEPVCAGGQGGERAFAGVALRLLWRDASHFAFRGSTKPPMRGFVRSLKRQRGEVAMPRQVDDVALRPGSIRALGDDP